jgi:NADH:ubiquinone oxidoreductase subunit 6 (subunit J)
MQREKVSMCRAATSIHVLEAAALRHQTAKPNSYETSFSCSTMSSTLNALGAILFVDFVRPCLDIELSDRTSNNIIKLIVIIVGAVCVLMVFLVDKVGGIVQVSI